jgi:hypothetical protein
MLIHAAAPKSPMVLDNFLFRQFTLKNSTNIISVLMLKLIKINELLTGIKIVLLSISDKK